MRSAAKTRSPEVVVFAGPTLPRGSGKGRWPELLRRMEVRPPAARGDVLAAVGHGAATIVLLDGYYYTVPSVTHKEILHALDSGVRIIGAASLGALRAAELEAFGMEGVGRVFECFRDGVLDGDDEVALLHGPAETGYLPLTVALVEVRHALGRLVEEGAVARAAAEALVAALKGTGFVERTAGRVRDLAAGLLPEAAEERLMTALEAPGVKERDARAALERAAVSADGDARGGTRSARPRGPRAPSAPQTGFLHYFKEQSIGPPLRARGGGVPLGRAWALAQALHPDVPAFVRAIRRRFLLRSAAVRAGLTAADRSVEKTAREMEHLHRRRFGAALLPPVDYLEEARIVELGRAACRELGGRAPALAGLARVLGLEDPEPEKALLALLGGQPDAIPQWWLARSFSLEPALEPALELARHAQEIRACLKRWSGGASVAMDSLVEVASELWGCESTEVFAAAAQRGLYEVPGASDGFRFVLELVAAAERLPVPINPYPGARRALMETPMRIPAIDRGANPSNGGAEDRPPAPDDSPRKSIPTPCSARRGSAPRRQPRGPGPNPADP